MSFVDIAILIFLGGFALAGFWFGIVHMIGSVLGTVLSVIIASRYFEAVAEWGSSTFGGGLNLWRIVAFALLYILVSRLLGLLLSVIDKASSVVSAIPLVGTFGRLLGAVFGFLEGVLVLGLVIYLASRFPFSQQFAQQLQASRFAEPLSWVGTLLSPLIPEAVRLLKSVL